MIQNATRHFTTLRLAPASQTRRHRPQRKRCLLRCPRLQRWTDRWDACTFDGWRLEFHHLDFPFGKRKLAIKETVTQIRKYTFHHQTGKFFGFAILNYIHHIIRNSLRGNDTVPIFLLMQVCHWFGQMQVYNSISHTCVHIYIYMIT